MADKVTFLASFPPIQSAIKVGDGMRIQLDIPESELPRAIKVVDLREAVLQVTITRADNVDAVPTKSSVVNGRKSHKDEVIT
jgi:hypothetical protein